MNATSERRKRKPRFANDAHMMLADRYVGPQRLNVQVRRFSLDDTLDRFACLAAHPFDMQGMQPRILAVENNDGDRIEMNHRFELDNQGFEYVRKLEMSTDGLRHAQKNVRAGFCHVLLRSSSVHVPSVPWPL